MDLDRTILIEFKETLKKRYGDQILKVILFGSQARGDFEEESDIDLAVIVRQWSPELRDEIYDVAAAWELKHERVLSVLLMSEGDFVRLKERERRIALDIEREGVPL
ncbi:MAG: nucleotidyltransferase domain-containing protein [Desulfobacterota bacterium]|nr:nucleotidyltransferase domain-containing protein [Thermodesulfobacteriota bacterium]